MNVRLTWLLTIHGFLYATYGFTLQKQLEQASSIKESKGGSLVCYIFGQTEVFLILVACIGISISVLGFLSIRAAQKSIHAAYSVFSEDPCFQTKTKHYTEKPSWRKHEQIYKVGGKELVRFPDIRGGGINDYVLDGQSAAWAIPIVLSASWIISIVFTVNTWHHNYDLSCF